MHEYAFLDAFIFCTKTIIAYRVNTLKTMCKVNQMDQIALHSLVSKCCRSISTLFNETEQLF